MVYVPWMEHDGVLGQETLHRLCTPPGHGVGSPAVEMGRSRTRFKDPTGGLSQQSVPYYPLPRGPQTIKKLVFPGKRYTVFVFENLSFSWF